MPCVMHMVHSMGPSQSPEIYIPPHPDLDPLVDKEAIKGLLVKVSEIIESYPEIREMDLNPVIVHERGLSIVDARIILNSGS